MHVAIELEWCHCLLLSAFDVKTNAALSRAPWWLCLQHRNNGIAREHISQFNQHGWRQGKTSHPLFRSAIHWLLPDKKSPQIKAISTMRHRTWIIIAKHTMQRCNQRLLLKLLVASWITEVLNTPQPPTHKSGWEQKCQGQHRAQQKCRKQPPLGKEGEIPHVNSELCCKHVQTGPLEGLDHFYLNIVLPLSHLNPGRL